MSGLNAVCGQDPFNNVKLLERMTDILEAKKAVEDAAKALVKKKIQFKGKPNGQCPYGGGRWTKAELELFNAVEKLNALQDAT